MNDKLFLKLNSGNIWEDVNCSELAHLNVNCIELAHLDVNCSELTQLDVNWLT
jgi:hypothetical protein